MHLFNITEIERSNNPPLLLEFYGGDITGVYSDILLISAFRSDYFPFVGTVFWRIKDKFGIEFGDHIPEGSKLVSEGLYEFPIVQNSAFSKLWVQEIKKSPNTDSSDSDIMRAFRHLENSAGVFDKLDIESISLPLLGTGSQGISIEISATRIMRVVKCWSSNSTKLKTVRIFAYDLKAASVLNNIIDSYFDVPIEQYSNSARELLRTATEELNHKKEKFKGQINKALNELYEIANTSNPSIKSIAVSGRILAEECSRCIHEKWYSNTDSGYLTLNERISKIQHRLLKEQSWILSYLRLLQSCGNSAAHPGKAVLNMVDACAVLISGIRVAEYTAKVENG